MIFTSPHKGLIIHLRDPQYYVDQSTGFREQTRPSLIADFLFANVSGQTTDEDGNSWISITGGMFDTDEQAELLGWTEEEKLYAEQVLTMMANKPSEPISLWEPPKAESRIPNWEKLSPVRAIAIASELGVVPEQLAYERSTQNREEIVAALEKRQASLLDEEMLAQPV